MKRPFPPAKKETGKIITTKLKQRASLQIWLRKEVIDGWTKGDKKRDRGQGTGDEREVISFTAKLPLSFWLYKPNLSSSFKANGRVC